MFTDEWFLYKSVILDSKRYSTGHTKPKFIQTKEQQGSALSTSKTES